MSPTNKLKVVLVTLSLPVMFGTQIQVVDSNVTEQIDTESGDTGGEGGYNDFSDFVPPTLNDTEAEDEFQIKLDWTRALYGLGNIGNKLELSDAKKQSLFEEVQSKRTSLKTNFRENFKLNGADNLNVLFDENRESDWGCNEEEAVFEFLNRTIAFLIYGNVTQDETRNQYAFMLKSDGRSKMNDEVIDISYAIKSNGDDGGSFCQSVLFFQYEFPAVKTTTTSIPLEAVENTTALTIESVTTPKGVHAADVFSSAVSSTGICKKVIVFAFSLILISM